MQKTLRLRVRRRAPVLYEQQDSTLLKAWLSKKIFAKITGLRF